VNHRDRNTVGFLYTASDALMQVPLSDPRCTDRAFAGDEVAVIARVADLLPAPPTTVVRGPLRAWDTGVDPGPLPPELVRRIMHPDMPFVTLRAWLVATDGATRPLGPRLYNIDHTAVADAAIEFAALGRRDPHATDAHGIALTMQRFIAADVSVQVTVPHDGGPILLRSSWGIQEEPGAGPGEDLLELDGPELTATGHRIAGKVVATVADVVGTRSVEVPPERRHSPALPVDQARAIARSCLLAVQRLGGGAELELAIEGGSVYLLTGRPS